MSTKALHKNYPELIKDRLTHRDYLNFVVIWTSTSTLLWIVVRLTTVDMTTSAIFVCFALSCCGTANQSSTSKPIIGDYLNPLYQSPYRSGSSSAACGSTTRTCVVSPYTRWTTSYDAHRRRIHLNVVPQDGVVGVTYQQQRCQRS